MDGIFLWSVCVQDPAAQVGEWQDGTRIVHFKMQLNAPDFIKKSIVVEYVCVREQQVLVWHSTTCFSITSETTVLNVPGVL